MYNDNDVRAVLNSNRDLEAARKEIERLRRIIGRIQKEAMNPWVLQTPESASLAGKIQSLAQGWQ